WQFRIQQYLQHEHYALWEVIQFSDSYKVPTNSDPVDSRKKDGRIVTVTTYDMQKKKNDKKPNSNSQDMAFISSSKNSNNEDGNTSNGSQIKFEDINQIDEDDMEEMDIKWNMALLSIRADKFWKRTGKEISIQGSDVDWSYMENEEDHALVVDGETPIEFALMANIENKVFDNSFYSKDCKKNTDSLNNRINELKSELSESNTYRYSYKLGVDQLEGRLLKYKEREVKYIEKIRTLEIYRESNLESIKILNNEVETLKEEKDVVDGKLARLLKSSKDVENIIESLRSEKVKEGVGYNVVPPPAADLYLSPKKDLSWTGLPEFVDDIVTDYSRPSPTVASASTEDQNKDTSTSEDVASPNPPKLFVKFVKPKEGLKMSKKE
nr:hypothetical protein [Tanacetum cinerariifolium]